MRVNQGQEFVIGGYTRAPTAFTTKKMADCIWLDPALAAQFEFLEWTADDRLRHSCFIGLREDEKAKSVLRE